MKSCLSSGESSKSRIELIRSTLDDPELLRRHMWDYRIECVEDIQEFAREQLRSAVWEEMSEGEKMRARVYALLYKGAFTSDANATNSIFEAAKAVADVGCEAESADDAISLMNSR